MARRRLVRQPAPPLEDEDVSQEEPEEEETADEEPAPAARPKAAAGGQSISKAEAVRRALAEGLDDLDDLEDFLKKQYRIEMPRPQLSAYKAQARAKERKAAEEEAPKPRRGRQPRQVAETGHVSQPAKPATTSGGDMFDDLTAIKHLVERLGGEQVRKIVGLFE